VRLRWKRRAAESASDVFLQSGRAPCPAQFSTAFRMSVGIVRQPERESTVCTQKSVAAGKVGPEQRRAFRGVHRRRRALFANRSRRRTLSEQEREKSHSWHSICFLRVEFIDCLSQIEFQDRKLYHEKVADSPFETKK
jgi:hypothetical protein